MARPRWIAFADARYPITSRGDRRGCCLVMAHTDEGALVWPEENDITPETVLCSRCLSQRFVPDQAMTQGGVVEQTGGRGFSRTPPATASTAR